MHCANHASASSRIHQVVNPCSESTLMRLLMVNLRHILLQIVWTPLSDDVFNSVIIEN